MCNGSKLYERKHLQLWGGRGWIFRGTMDILPVLWQRSRCKRQMGPHAHSVVLTPDGRHAVVSDLGTDRLKIYKTDFDNKRILTENVAEFETGAGSGPRFCTFNRIGTRCYVFCEITSTIMVLNIRKGILSLCRKCRL